MVRNFQNLNIRNDILCASARPSLMDTFSARLNAIDGLPCAAVWALRFLRKCENFSIVRKISWGFDKSKMLNLNGKRALYDVYGFMQAIMLFLMGGGSMVSGWLGGLLLAGW